MIAFLLATLAGFAASEMFLTNCFGLTTYLMFGLATVAIRLADPRPPLPDLRFSGAMFGRTVLLTVLFLAIIYIFTKYSVDYG